MGFLKIVGCIASTNGQMRQVLPVGSGATTSKFVEAFRASWIFFADRFGIKFVRI